jgi:protein SSD1
MSQTLDYAALTGGMNNQLAAQLAQLQQLQLMQQTLNQAQQQSNPATMQQALELQTQMLAQMQASQTTNTPPRFLAQQSPEMGNMGNMMAEQMVLQQQLELLKAQQDALLSRFAEMQVASPPGLSSPPMPSGTAASSCANAARSSGGHRRYQSQQVSSSNNAGGMSAFAGLPSAMGQFSQPGGFTYSQGQQSGLPKGHGRRHSVNVVGKSTNGSATSPPLPSAPLPTLGSMVMSPSMDFGSDLDFGASPTLGSAIGSPPMGNPSTGWVPGHRSRESRSSISSLSGWGTSGSFRSLCNLC